MIDNFDAGSVGRTRRRLRYTVIGALVIAVIVIFGIMNAVWARTSVPVIKIHATRFAFAPSEITLKKGEPVELVFVADDVEHGIAVEGLNIDGIDLMKHKARRIFLTPETVGDFPGECSHYCGRGHYRMTFMVHVRP